MRAGVLLGLAAACASPAKVEPIEVAEGDVVLVGELCVGDGSTRLRGARLLEYAGAVHHAQGGRFEQANVGLGEDAPCEKESLVGGVVLPRGQVQVPLELLSAIVLTTRAGVAGRCGGCESNESQLAIRPGDSCRVPTWGRDFGDARVASALRERLWLESTGDCSCEFKPVEERDRRVDFRFATNRTDPWPVSQWVRTGDGAVWVFDEEHAARIAPDGTRRDRDRLSSPPCATEVRALPFLGSVVAAGEIDPENVVVVSVPSSDRFSPELHVFSRTLGARPLPSVEGFFVADPITARSAPRFRRLETPSGPLNLILGRSFVRLAPIVIGCTADACETLPAPYFFGEEVFIDAAVTASGRLLIAGRNRTVTLGRPRAGDYDWTTLAPVASISNPDPMKARLAVRSMEWVAAVGERAYACFEEPPGAPEMAGLGSVIATATVTDGELDWRGVLDLPYTCGDVVTHDGVVEWFGEYEHTSAIFRADGTMSITPNFRAPLGFEDLTRVRFVVGDAVYAARRDGGIVRRTPRESKVLYGTPTQLTESEFMVSLADAEGFVSFGVGGVMHRVSADGAVTERLVIGASRGRPFAAGEVIHGAVVDRRSGGWILVGGRGIGGGGFVRRVARDLGYTEVDIGAARALELIDIASVGDDDHLVVASGTTAFRLRGDAWSRVEIDWRPDDASTLGRPPPLVNQDCGPRSRHFPSPERREQGPDLFRAVDGANGVAWIVGCSETLVRVDLRAAEPIGELVEFDRPPTDFLPRRGDFLRVRADCPKDVLVAADGVNDLTSLGLVWRVRPDGARATARATVRPVENWAPVGALYSKPHLPFGLVGDLARPTMLLATGHSLASGVFRFSGERFFVTTAPLTTIAQRDDGGIFVGGLYARILIGHQCR